MFLVFLFFLSLDRLLKLFFLKNQMLFQNDFLELKLVKNSGSFLFLVDKSVLIGISFLIVFLLVLFIIRYKNKLSPSIFFALILIIVGGVSNFYDRIFFGFVVDYVKIFFFPFVFNFSDVIITLGCFLVFWLFIK